MRINFLILLSVVLLLLIFVLFFSLLIYRKLVGVTTGKVERAMKKHGDLVSKLVEGDHSSVQEISHMLKTLGNLSLAEAILEKGASQKNVPAGYFSDYYDAAGITEKHLNSLKKSKSWKKRALAAEKLGQIGSAKAVPHLIDMIRDVKDEDEDVRGASLRALGRIKDSRAIPFLIEALGYPETWLPPRIGEILYSIGEEAIDPLIKELRNFKNENKRIWSAEILGWLEAENAAMHLMETLSDVSPEVRAKSVGALGKIKDGRAVGKLLEMLISEPVPFVRVRVAQALGAIGHPSVIDYLINILKDPEWWVRVRAVEALEQIGESSVPGLLVALEDEDGEVRRRAAMALERMGYIGKVLREYGEEEFKPELRKILFLVITAGITEGISEKLFHSEATLQKRVVRLFGEAGNKKSAGALLELLNDTTDWTLKSRIIESLGKMGASEAIRDIIKYLTHEEYWVRTASVESLGKLQADEFAAEIADILDDPSPIARESALKALLRLKIDSYGSRIEKLLDDPSAVVRATAIYVIRDLHIHLESGKIAEHLTDPADEVRVEAIKYFSMRQDKSVFSDVARLLSGSSQDTRTAVAEYFVAVKPAPFQKIIGLFSIGDLTREEVSTLMEVASGLGGKEAHQFVLEYTENEDNFLREHAFLRLPAFEKKEDGALFKRGLIDPLEGVRIAALIGGLRSSSVRTVMKNAAHLSADPIEEVRVAFALAAGVAGLPEFGSPLLKMLSDPSPRVIAAALIGLASFDDPSNLDLIYEKGKVGEIREEIKHIEADARFQSLLRSIRKREQETRNVEVGLILAPDMKDFVNELIARVKESLDEMSRVKAMSALKLVASSEHFSSLLGVMKRDPSPAVRIKAMEAVASVGREDEVISALSSMLVDPAMEVKVKAAGILGGFGGAKALEALLHSIDTYDREFREAVTTSLSRILMKDPARVNELIRSIPVSKTRKLGMIWLMGKTRKRGCMKYLINMLEDADGDVRAAAVGALAKFKRKQLMSQLQKVLQDPNERVRAAAVNAISSSGDPSAYPFIEEMLSDVDEFVRKRAAIGLGKLDAKKAQKTVMKALKRYPELESVSTGILYGAGISYEELPNMNSEAKKVVLELCPEEEMISLARSSRETKKRLHGIRVLALNQGAVFREIINTALKDPSPEIREEAEKYRSR